MNIEKLQSLRINPKTHLKSKHKERAQRKQFVFAGQETGGKRLGSAISLGFVEKSGAIGCWIYKKGCSLS
jgi:hypothetical protein